LGKAFLWIGGVLFLLGAVIFSISVFDFPKYSDPLVASREETKSVFPSSVAVSQTPTFQTGNVTVEIFSDYTCPYCRSFWTKTIQPFREAYADKPVSFFIRHFPVGQGGLGEMLGKYSICASEQKDFWKVSDVLFSEESFSAETLVALSQKLEIDHQKVEECMARADVAEKIQKDISEGKEMGIRGSPTTFINGEKFEGNLPIENLDLEIFTLLKK
jgi:protein-disulfide isomerase